MCVLILSWDSFSCHLFGFSANNEIIMRSLMGLKKKRRKNTSHELSHSPSPSFCFSVRSLLHNRSLSLDLRQNWRRPGVGNAPICSFWGTECKLLPGGECSLSSPPSPVPPWTPHIPPSLTFPTWGWQEVKASIWFFCRLNAQFIWGAYTPLPTLWT